MPKILHFPRILPSAITVLSIIIDNAILIIPEAGIYDVTFTFNSVTKEVSATAVRTDTDGISQIAGDVKAKNVVFNLQGHRVSTPKQGVYIINGKKVVVK